MFHPRNIGFMLEKKCIIDTAYVSALIKSCNKNLYGCKKKKHPPDQIQNINYKGNTDH